MSNPVFTCLQRLACGILAIAFAVLFTGCAHVERASPIQQQGVPALNHGYALLWDLMGDESNVSKLHFIKHERGELVELIKDISQKCGQAHEQLTKFGKTDVQLNLKDSGLPAAETETRKAISKTKAKALLTEKGKEFEVQLLLSQNEALTYGAHLASTVALNEPNAERAQYLRGLSTELTELQRKVQAEFFTNYNWVDTK